ncbi:ABC-2 family transporter protein [soil metagenome]
MLAVQRYLRLFWAMARFGLLRELAFRGNFLVKMSVELIWLGILLGFYRIIFTKTAVVAEWTEWQYLFFVGCFYAVEGLMETLFLENCNSFADLVRSGDLDFYLLKPIDEQFLITCRNIEWSTAPNCLLGFGVMVLSVYKQGIAVHPLTVLLFLAMLVCGIAIAYGCLVMLTSTSVWLMRNQSLYELWWLFTSLVRYPREIYNGNVWSAALGYFFWFVVPILLVVNVPSRVMMKVFDPWNAVFMAFAAVVLLFVSRQFFRFSLRKYRSASS